MTGQLSCQSFQLYSSEISWWSSQSIGSAFSSFMINTISSSSPIEVARQRQWYVRVVNHKHYDYASRAWTLVNVFSAYANYLRKTNLKDKTSFYTHRWSVVVVFFSLANKPTKCRCILFLKFMFTINENGASITKHIRSSVHTFYASFFYVHVLFCILRRAFFFVDKNFKYKIYYASTHVTKSERSSREQPRDTSAASK